VRGVTKLLGLLALLGACAVTPAPSSGPEPTEPPFPIEPLSAGSVGDWIALSGVWSFEGTTAPCQLSLRIGAMDADSVTMRHCGVGEVESSSIVFPRGVAPSLSRFFDLGGGTVTSMTICEERHSVLGHLALCRRLDFGWNDGLDTLSVTAWFLPGMRLGGLVALDMRESLGNGSVATTVLELSATGHDSLPDPEPRADKIAREMGPSVFGDAIAGTVFEHARVGDWVTYEQSLSARAGVAERFVALRVVGVTDHAVELEGDEHDVRSTGGVSLSPLRLGPFARNHAGAGWLVAKVSELDGYGLAKTRASREAFTRPVAGREFAGTGVTADLARDGFDASVDIFFSSDVTACELVGCELAARDRDGLAATIKLEIRGFGTADRTTWGKTFAELTGGEK
jgi:hypothetical protein